MLIVVGLCVCCAPSPRGRACIYLPIPKPPSYRLSSESPYRVHHTTPDRQGSTRGTAGARWVCGWSEVGRREHGARDTEVWGDDDGLAVWGRVDIMAGSPLGGGRSFLQHTHPHLLSSPVGRAAEGLLWSLIQLLLLLQVQSNNPACI